MVILTVVSTKGGTGKTTLTAALAAVLADMGFRVLMVDTDTQASLSKYYPLHRRAPDGTVELLLGKNDEASIRSTISNTVYPNLDIVMSNNIRDDVQSKVYDRPDRAFLLRNKLIHPYIRKLRCRNNRHQRCGGRDSGCCLLCGQYADFADHA